MSEQARVLILGSGSPRRREILENLRIAHEVFLAAVDEDVRAGEAPEAYLWRVVRAKLAAVAKALPETLKERATAILVADTSVIVAEAGGPVILGKPANVAEAARMIALLAGQTHEVKTRFALGSPEGGVLHEETVTTAVTFRALGTAQVEAYAASGEGLDKAGGYAIQGLGSGLVARILGSYSNVVGLPACELVVALEALSACA